MQITGKLGKNSTFLAQLSTRGGGQEDPTYSRKRPNRRNRYPLPFLSNLFFRFDRTRRGFSEISLVEIKISTRRCISGRERNGRIGRFCEDRSAGGNFHRNYRRPFIRLCGELRIYKMERFHAATSDRGKRRSRGS